MSKQKPFLSVVVPCYNSSKYLPHLIQSVVDCEMEDIELILVDDCSDDNYDDIVAQYSDKLDISQYRTDHNCGSPSNSREIGASKATGTYLTFVDHDDYLIPEGIQELRRVIEEKDNPEYICCGIRQVDEEGNTQIEKYDILPFLHGKFFNMDKFYRKCDLHHKQDIKYQEDNYFTALIACNLIKYNLAPTFEHFCTYAWFNNEKSLGQTMKRRKETDAKLNLDMFYTNISISEEVMFKFVDEDALPYEVACEWLIRELVSMYLDCQIYWKFIDDRKEGLARLIDGVKARLNLDTKGILDIAFADDGRLFLSELDSVLQFQEEPITPQIKFDDFLEKYSGGAI